MRKKGKPVDWSLANWSKPNWQIALALGVSESWVAENRKRLGMPKVSAGVWVRRAA